MEKMLLKSTTRHVRIFTAEVVDEELKFHPNRIFSFHESISLLLSIADTPLTGAGISGKSNLL